MNHTERAVLWALVQESAARLALVVARLPLAPAAAWLAGDRVCVLAGNHLRASERRVKPLRDTRAALAASLRQIAAHVWLEACRTYPRGPSGPRQKKGHAPKAEVQARGGVFTVLSLTGDDALHRLDGGAVEQRDDGRVAVAAVKQDSREGCESRA